MLRKTRSAIKIQYLKPPANHSDHPFTWIHSQCGKTPPIKKLPGVKTGCRLRKPFGTSLHASAKKCIVFTIPRRNWRLTSSGQWTTTLWKQAVKEKIKNSKTWRNMSRSTKCPGGLSTGSELPPFYFPQSHEFGGPLPSVCFHARFMQLTGCVWVWCS